MTEKPQDVGTTLRRLACRDRLGLLSAGHILTSLSNLRPISFDVGSDSIDELLYVERAEDPKIWPLFRRALAETGVVEPSVSEAAWTLALEAAVELAAGNEGPRNGAWRMVEIL